jgi:hypothetical protein
LSYEGIMERPIILIPSRWVEETHRRRRRRTEASIDYCLARCLWHAASFSLVTTHASISDVLFVSPGFHYYPRVYLDPEELQNH